MKGSRGPWLLFHNARSISNRERPFEGGFSGVGASYVFSRQRKIRQADLM